MKGYYDPEQSGKGLEVPTGRLSIEGRNMPEFRKLVEQAKKEADQLKKRLISSSILISVASLLLRSYRCCVFCDEYHSDKVYNGFDEGFHIRNISVFLFADVMGFVIANP